MSKGILLVNLGSPDSTSIPDVRRYLKQFLNDPRVIHGSKFTRWVVVNLLILPFRPKNTAHAYSRVWTQEGSPLIVTSKKVQKLLQKEIDLPIELGMSYGNPSIPSAIKKLKDAGVTEFFAIPLYPHYAMSSYETAVAAIHDAAKKCGNEMNFETMQPFYKEEGYIDALVERAKPYLKEDFDHILFSFHGLPVSHLRATDPTQIHCCRKKMCCKSSSPAHATCYKHQCLETVRIFTEKARLPENKYSVSYQSRLTKEPWLEPYTDKTIEELPKNGVKKLLIMSPAFVTDCLETLEELDMAGKEAFLKAGGEDYKMIPCLNEHPMWIKFLKEKIEAWKQD